MIAENLINCRNLYNFVQKQTKKGVAARFNASTGFKFGIRLKNVDPMQ